MNAAVPGNGLGAGASGPRVLVIYDVSTDQRLSSHDVSDKYGTRSLHPNRAVAASCRAPASPTLLDRVGGALRSRQYSPSTEKSCLQWIRRYIFFDHVRHPAEMGESEINHTFRHSSATRLLEAGGACPAVSRGYPQRTGTSQAK